MFTYLDCGDGFMGAYMSTLNKLFKYVPFTVCPLYFNTADLKNSLWQKQAVAILNSTGRQQI